MRKVAGGRERDVRQRLRVVKGKAACRCSENSGNLVTAVWPVDLSCLATHSAVGAAANLPKC